MEVEKYSVVGNQFFQIPPKSCQDVEGREGNTSKKTLGTRVKKTGKGRKKMVAEGENGKVMRQMMGNETKGGKEGQEVRRGGREWKQKMGNW